MTHDKTEDEWMEEFETGGAPNGAFHHMDHVRMAFLYVRKYPPLEALARFSSGLMRLAAANGRPDLYHETITWAFVLLIRERMARANRALTWLEFSKANPDLLRWDDHVLKRYYRPETLASGLAKKVFLLPDNL
jgi:hypothetical protein